MKQVEIGYSGKSIWQKLGIREGMRVLVVNEPPEYSQIMIGAPNFNLVKKDEKTELLHLFETSADQLNSDYTLYSDRVELGGIIWISWPKKTSGMKTDITEQTIRGIILPSGWVDVKVAAISEVWSGLKFLKRIAK